MYRTTGAAARGEDMPSGGVHFASAELSAVQISLMLGIGGVSVVTSADNLKIQK